ncbi:4-hydroxy-tetrahydrodipicolinate synthase (plasmid) [Polaromonas sp. P1-6]|nr:4-hydroxy-tetrahydrodipicolinate synthase [Polaromonas sp. P1-6]
MSTSTIKGSIPAVVTPMAPDGAIDYAAFQELLDWHIAEGSDAIVVAGTTGESATISGDEQCLMLEKALKHVVGRVPVIVGTGANATAEAIELAAAAKRLGADAHLSVVPYYNKPSQEGMYCHFRAIAEAVDLPMILYNVPGRTVADLSNATVLRLMQVPGIVGLKDATGDIERGAHLLKHAPPGFDIYSGDDGTALALMLLGASGTISVTANVAPRLMHAMCAAAIAGDLPRARSLNKQLLDLHRAVFLDPNPVPVKWALHRLGRIQSGLRLPLTPLRSELIAELEGAMREAGIDPGGLARKIS